eukprot:NODE_9123_length_1445_cov_7.555387.p1 GENE.NODE_9123_length_1445_cov_7.555387~~NODE_9123_length_1445_cov_7.555387.p1  ORF type:complete len:336 (-),score=54.47 NODE_9123_length_1445_cov_7.555387:267-1274(-)
MKSGPSSGPRASRLRKSARPCADIMPRAAAPRAVYYVQTPGSPAPLQATAGSSVAALVAGAAVGAAAMVRAANVLTATTVPPPSAAPGVPVSGVPGASTGAVGAGQPQGTPPGSVPEVTGNSDPGTGRGRFQEMTSLIRRHVQETRDDTALLRRLLEMQQVQHQRALDDLKNAVEEAKKQRTANTQRVEISAESLQSLRALLYPGAEPVDLKAVAAVAEGVPQSWLDQVYTALDSLLSDSASSKDARRALQTVSMMVHNLVTNPSQEKYREVDVTSTVAEQNDAAAVVAEPAGRLRMTPELGRPCAAHALRDRLIYHATPGAQLCGVCHEANDLV